MAYYKPGDVVWAKMRGHPPWPATILQTSTQLTGVPSGRYSVKFYGTYETAIMKSADLFDFLKHRHQFEVHRENKGFAVAVQEARKAAGLPTDGKNQGAKSVEAAVTPSTSSDIGTTRSNNRPRRPSSKFNTDDYVLQPLRGRANSQSHHITESPQKTKNKTTKSDKKSVSTTERRRRESGGSISGHRKRTISSFFDLDDFDNDPMLTPMLGDSFGNSLLDGIHGDGNSESPGAAGSKHKRTPKPRLFEDFIAPGRSRTPSRERNNSTSSSGRTRLISGVSDILEELGDQQFNAADFLSVLNDFDDDRPASPEEPLPMPAPIKYCVDCACLCELYGLKWRCTNKSCLKWNGTHDPYGKDGELSRLKADGMLSNSKLPETAASTSISDLANIFSGTFDVKTESPKAESFVPLVKSEPFFAPEVKTEPIQPFGILASTSFADAPGVQSSSFQPPAFDTSFQPPPLDSTFQPPVRGSNFQPSTIDTSFQAPAFDRSVAPVTSSPLFSTKEPAVNNAQVPLTTASNSSNLSVLPRRQLGAGRPKSYKVEKTPPVTENGQRLCAFCGGQVRPQMCGGNKHRWRCVDKKCRKWYGWVRSNEEIPKDLGKKGRWKDLALKIRRKGVSDEDGDSTITTDGNSKPNSYISNAVPLCERQPKKLGRPPKPRVGKVKLKIKKKANGITVESETSAAGDGERPKRKYTRREKPAEEEKPLRFSPIPQEALSFRPSAMERRGRWWTNEKRRHDVSPEREWNARSPLDTAAAMHVLAQSMRVAANTLADEQGTVNGSLDLLMDALMSSLAPLLSLTAQLPTINVSDEVLQQLWNSSSVHTPIFS